MKSMKRGFTLIELLVVIAIIGILAAIVLAAVGTARSKGVDAAVKGQLDSARSQMELYASNHSNSYAGGCVATQANLGLATIMGAAASSTGATVQNNANGAAGKATCEDAAGTSWAAEAPMTTGFWCVDSTGVSKQEAGTTITTASPACG